VVVVGSSSSSGRRKGGGGGSGEVVANEDRDQTEPIIKSNPYEDTQKQISTSTSRNSSSSSSGEVVANEGKGGSVPAAKEIILVISSRSWLQDTVKRRLVDFAWNRRFFYLPGACSLFRVYPAERFNQPEFLYPERLF